MALRIPIPAATLTAGLDSLVVFGVGGRSASPRPPTQLADLLDAHHYTDGLAFVRPGTPTNNTDDRRAGYSSDDPGHERSFAIEVDRARRRSTDNNALRVGTALGLPLRSDRCRRSAASSAASTRDDRHMRSMNTALWQVGWGYFLSNMIGPEAGLTPSGHRLGARALSRPRAQLRTVPGAALRRAAVRRAAGDVARSVAARRRRAGRGAGRVAQRHADLAARQRLAAATGLGGAHRQPAEPDPIPTPISPT